MGNFQDDIIRYKKGELSPKEMHALEKKALNDPFLAEALEGLENISAQTLSNDVEDLNQKILKEKKTVLFTPLRIAAGVLLISGSVFLFYQLMPKQENIALNKENQSQPSAAPKAEPQKPEEKKDVDKNDVSTKSFQKESGKAKPQEGKAESPKSEKEKLEPQVDQIASEIVKPKIENQPVIAEQKQIAGPEKKADEAKVEIQDKAGETVAMEPVKEIPAQQDLKLEGGAVGRAAKKAKYKSEELSGTKFPYTVSPGIKPISGKVISGKVISAEDGLPIPGVNVVIDGTTAGTVTNADGSFTLQTTTENQRLVFSFIGLQTQQVDIEGKNNVDVELKSDATQLNEVVVTGLGGASDTDKEPVIHLANPRGGKRAYNKYLETNVRYPEEALKNKIKGKVRVEFSVHTDGSLDQYLVVKSLGYGYDEEVIRLIKEGPKWSPTTENGRPVESTVRVGVKFDPSKAGR